MQGRHQPVMLIFYLVCYAAVLKFLTQYYAQYYAHVKEWCLNLTILLEYIHLCKNI